jgi:acyl-CoA:acyl-CoA alkyltransferase
MSKICIDALTYIEAPFIRTSKEIEERIKFNMDRFGFPERFIESMSGIIERRMWEPELSIRDVGLLSAKKLLNDYPIDKDKIGCIINPSVCRDYIEPTLAAMYHDSLKLNDRCINFDVNNACLGFSQAVNIISSMLKTKEIDFGLIIDAESSRNVIDLTCERISDPEISIENFLLEFASLTLGSGSISMLLCREEDAKFDKHIIEETMFVVDSKHNMLCNATSLRQMLCDAHTMLKAGIPLVNKTWEICQHEFSIWDDNIDYYIPHQVSMPHTKALLKCIKIKPEKMELIFPFYGNTGPIAWPMGLSIAEREGRIKKGNNIGVLSMGSGFNCSCMRLTW